MPLKPFERDINFRQAAISNTAVRDGETEFFSFPAGASQISHDTPRLRLSAAVVCVHEIPSAVKTIWTRHKRSRRRLATRPFAIMAKRNFFYSSRVLHSVLVIIALKIISNKK